jgi:hypothetical protein
LPSFPGCTSGASNVAAAGSRLLFWCAGIPSSGVYAVAAAGLSASSSVTTIFSAAQCSSGVSSVAVSGGGAGRGRAGRALEHKPERAADAAE